MENAFLILILLAISAIGFFVVSKFDKLFKKQIKRKTDKEDDEYKSIYYLCDDSDLSEIEKLRTEKIL